MLHIVKDPPALPIYVRAEEVRIGDQFWSGFGRHRKLEGQVVANNQGNLILRHYGKIQVMGRGEWEWVNVPNTERKYHRHSVLAVFRP